MSNDQSNPLRVLVEHNRRIELIKYGTTTPTREQREKAREVRLKVASEFEAARDEPSPDAGVQR